MVLNDIELKKAQSIMLLLLKKFAFFCEENNISYFLHAGTLLGAVRHNGFIPWDDDADVMVTREEYKKLVSLLSRTDDIVVFKACFLDRVSTRALIKEGYYIDLFVNDVMPENKLMFKLKVVLTGILRTYFYGNTVENVWHRSDSELKTVFRGVFTNLLGRVVETIYKRRDIFSTNDNVADIKGEKPSEYYTRFTSRMYETNRRFRRKKYDMGYRNVMFEGHKLMALKNAEDFLIDMYGDYRQLPSINKRCPSHPVNMLDSVAKCFKFYN